MAHKEKGGIFNVTKGMQQEFGKDRVFNAPIAEDYIMGTANGMSRFNDKIRIVAGRCRICRLFLARHGSISLKPLMNTGAQKDSFLPM